MAKHVARAPRGKRYRRRSLGKRILGGIGIFVASLIVVCIGVCSIWIMGLPECDEEAFDTAAVTEVYASDHQTLLARFQLQNRLPLSSLNETSAYVRAATVATEDERFYEHGAVDFYGIARAAVNNVTGGSREGASTITQQLVRNTVLADEMNDITIKRKFREAALAFQVEDAYSKDQILLMYLNTINYGSGAYGIEAASERYFSKPSSELTIAESALLVGIPQSPTYNNPIDNPENAKARRNLVLDRMVSCGCITLAEAAQAKAEDIVLNTSEISQDGIIMQPYFTSYVRDMLLEQLTFDQVFQGGLTVYTTLDLDIQAAAEAAAETKVKEAGSDFECAMTAIDPSTGYVKAMVGGKDYYENQWNLAAQGKRQPGSSFKTFTLVAALEQGISPKTYVNCYPEVKIGDWEVHNYNYHDYGCTSIANAFAVSSNTGFARLCMAVGPDSIIDTARRMGITSDLDPSAGLTLGISEVSTLEMADAYATIANGGTHYDAVVIEKAIDRKGRTVINNTNPRGTRAISSEVAYAATEVMKGVVTSGTGTAANLRNGQEVAGKTGTTDNDKDKWFCGITPQLSVAIWLGDRDNVKSPQVTAVSAFATFMNKVLAGQQPQQFPKSKEPEYTKKFDNADLDLKDLTTSYGSYDWDGEDASSSGNSSANTSADSAENTASENTASGGNVDVPSGGDGGETPQPDGGDFGSGGDSGGDTGGGDAGGGDAGGSSGGETVSAP